MYVNAEQQVPFVFSGPGQVSVIKRRRFEPTGVGGEEGRGEEKGLTGGTAMRSVVARARSVRDDARLIDRRYPSRARRPLRRDGTLPLDFSVFAAAPPGPRPTRSPSRA